MRALVIATGFESQLDALGPQWPSPMLSIGDRPIVQHVIERLVVAGFRDIDVVLSSAANRVEHHLGNGQRWGCRIQYHLTSGYDKAASLIPAVASQGESFLLAQGDILPVLPLGDFGGSDAIVFRASDAASGHCVHQDWTGWAWVPGEESRKVPAFSDWNAVAEWLASGKSVVREAVPALSTRTGDAYLTSQRIALTDPAQDLHFSFSAFAAEPGIWIGRNVSLPPSAQLIAPVLLGDNSQIGEGAKLGPNAVVCPGCVIDDRTVISDSVVLEGSYIGRDLDVQMSVVNRSRLCNVTLGTSLLVTDAFLLGGISSEAERHVSLPSRIARWIGRLLAIPFVLLFWVVAAIRFLAGSKPAIHWLRFAKTPCDPEGLRDNRLLPSFASRVEARKLDGWRHFWLVFLPGLVSVVSGHINVVGPEPRTAEELAALPEDWRALCLQTPPGLLPEWFVLYGPDAEEDLRFTSDAMHVALGNWTASLKLLGRYAALLALGRPDSAETGIVRGSH